MCDQCQCNHDHNDVQSDNITDIVVSTIFGTFTVPDEVVKESLLEDEKDA